MTPFKDPEKKREYQKLLMRERRKQEKQGEQNNV
jgi:hypothetical protein